MPPNPKEFDTTTSGAAGRPSPGRQSKSQAGSGRSRVIVGGSQRPCIANPPIAGSLALRASAARRRQDGGGGGRGAWGGVHARGLQRIAVEERAARAPPAPPASITSARASRIA